MTLADLAKTVARFGLGLLLGVLLIRGVMSIVAPAPAQIAPSRDRAPVEVSDQARALAVEFAAAWLAYDPDEDPDQRQARLEQLAAPELADDLQGERADDAAAQTVSGLVVSDTRQRAPGRALVTVTGRVRAHEHVTTRRVVVPVAQTPAGLVVDGLPSLVAAPGRAVVEIDPGEPLPPEVAVGGLLDRFFADYLAGDAQAVANGPAAPGARLGALEDPLEFEQIISVRAVAGAPRGEQDALVDVQARDTHADAQLRLGYRVRLRRGDRWYVAAINPTSQGG